MPLPDLIILLGLRGSGKTTIARELATTLRRTAIDLDDLTAEELNATTPGEALRTHGELAFRDAEARALDRALRQPSLVLALGGGTPTHEPSAALLRATQVAGRAYLIYLRATPATLFQRITASTTDRPALTDKPIAEEVADLHAHRDPLYTGMVQSVINVDSHTLDQTTDAVLSAIPRDSI